MGIFDFFRKKSDLLSTTQNLISELHELVAREQIITKAEFGKVQKMFEHVTAVEEKLNRHDGLLKSMKPRDQRRLAVLQAEFGDVEELRNAIKQLFGELNRLTELQRELNMQMLQKSNEQIHAIQKARLEQTHEEPEGVEKYLDDMRGKK